MNPSTESPTLTVPLSSTAAWARLTDAKIVPTGLRARILQLPLGTSALKLVDRATAAVEGIADKVTGGKTGEKGSDKPGLLANLSLQTGRRVARAALERVLSPKQRDFLERHSSVAASILAKPGAEATS
jgi:hypothetical protein